MGRALTANVVVIDPATGAPAVLLKGTTAPGWALGQLGDHVLVADDGYQDGPAIDGPRTEVDELVDPDGEPVVVDITVEPPRGGAGSGRDPWAAYAASIGVEVDDDMVRDDIVAAVDAATEAAEG